MRVRVWRGARWTLEGTGPRHVLIGALRLSYGLNIIIGFTPPVCVASRSSPHPPRLCRFAVFSVKPTFSYNTNQRLSRKELAVSARRQTEQVMGLLSDDPDSSSSSSLFTLNR